MSAGKIKSRFGYKVFRAFGLTLVAVSVIISAVLVHFQRIAVRDDLEKEGRMLASLLAYSARTWVFAENREMLKDAVQGIMERKNVAGVRIYNADRQLLYREELRPIPQQGPAVAPAVGPADADQEHVQVRDAGEALLFAAPVTIEATPGTEAIYFEPAPASARRISIGMVEVALDKRAMRDAMKAILFRNALIAAAILVFSGAAIFLVMQRVMRPLTRLAESIRLLGTEGAADKIPVESDDEVGMLATDFNAMSDNLQRRDDEKRALEERLRHAAKMEAVGTLARGIAHDFNNILATIRGAVFMIERKSRAEGGVAGYFAKIHSAVRKAEGLTQGLFTFSRTQTIHPQLVDINSIIARALPVLAGIAGERVTIAASLCEGSLPAMADPLQIEQVLLNLCTNARDAIPGNGTVTIGTRLLPPAAADEAGYVLITVADTGAGMDAATRERIFEPFFTTKAPGKGTGLGLSIIYGIIQQHGGSIDLETEPGTGSTFTIRIPSPPDRDRRQEPEKDQGEKS